MFTSIYSFIIKNRTWSGTFLRGKYGNLIYVSVLFKKRNYEGTIILALSFQPFIFKTLTVKINSLKHQKSTTAGCKDTRKFEFEESNRFLSCLMISS